MQQRDALPFFSIGYADKERVEVILIRGSADQDWIKGLVRIEVGAFKGELEISLWLSDVIHFKEQVQAVYEQVHGVAEFRTFEDQLFIHIEVDKLGHVQATGYVIDEPGDRLDFDMRYDQTLLWHTISEIDKALFEMGVHPESSIGGENV